MTKKEQTNAHNEQCLQAYMDSKGLEGDALPFCDEWQKIGEVQDGTLTVDLMKRKTPVGGVEYATYDGSVTSPVFDTSIVSKDIVSAAFVDAFSQDPASKPPLAKTENNES